MMVSSQLVDSKEHLHHDHQEGKIQRRAWKGGVGVREA